MIRVASLFIISVLLANVLPAKTISDQPSPIPHPSKTGQLTTLKPNELLPPGTLTSIGSTSEVATQNSSCLQPSNAIVAENCKPGSDNWALGEDLKDITGFAKPVSADLGEVVTFLVDTEATTFNLDIYRSGFYGGKGARLVTTAKNLKGIAQPACHYQVDTGLVSCSNWTPSYTLTIPKDWVSGVYLARIQRPDTGGTTYAMFVVRDDSRKSDILYQQSTFTYHAYNNFRGPSVYDDSNPTDLQCSTIAGTDRAVKVSLNRPYNRDFLHEWNMYIAVEFSMVRWLEQQGYDVTYSTSLDTHRSGKAGAHNALLDHKTFLIVGHDEYWTQEIRDAITAARDAGVNIGIFSANTGYWRVRLEADPWSGEPDSVIVTYKTTQNGPPDPSGRFTGTWRDPAGQNDPENALVGVQYVGDNDTLTFPMRVLAEQTSDRLYRHTGLQNMPPGTNIELGKNVVGWEWDAVTDNGHTPPGLTVLASSPTFGYLLVDSGTFTGGGFGQATVNTTRYVAKSGAIVFASGMIQWSWGLSGEGWQARPPDPQIQQMTYNALADMGSQPATPAQSIILDGETGEQPVPTGAILPVSAAKPVISDIEANVQGNEVRLTWNTDTETLGQVWYGTQRDHLLYGKVSGQEYEKTSTVGLGLNFSTTYYYAIVVRDRVGHTAVSDVRTFTMDDAPLKTKVAETLRSALRVARCQSMANPPLVIGTGVGGTAVVLFVGWRVIVFVRRRRGKRSRAPQRGVSLNG